MSILNKSCISHFRYVAILNPLRQRRARAVFAVIGVICVVSFLVAIPTLLFATTLTYYNKDVPFRTVCFVDWQEEEEKKKYVHLGNILIVVTLRTVYFIC